MDDAVFRDTATELLLGDCPIEQAFQNCLLFIREEIPADFFSLHVFDPGLGIMETVVDATPESSPRVSHKTTLGSQARELIREAVRPSPQAPIFTIIDDLGRNEMGRQLGLELKTPNSPCLALNLRMRGRDLGITALTNTRGVKYTEEDGRRFTLLHAPLAVLALNLHLEREIAHLRDVFRDEKEFFQAEILGERGKDIVGADHGLRETLELCRQVAPADSPVLLLGETGVGKEVLAGAIHRLSPRRKGPFIKINCGAIPQTLIESELFGHEKGAFTGAINRRKGFFERAEAGTIFLDEIGELPPEAQTRFLQVLQDRTIVRVGGTTPRKVDIRVIAATHRDLGEAIESGRFRQDLFYRLNVFPITIPPLRERKRDIPPLVRHVIRKKSRDMGLPRIPEAVPGVIDRLTAYDWPGNVRELENVVERELILSNGAPLAFAEFATGRSAPGAETDMSLDRALVRHITLALALAHGKVSGTGGAAELLRINPKTLQSKMRKLGMASGRKAKGLYAGRGDG